MCVDRGFLGRRWRCVAGGNSMSNTGLESHVPPAAAGFGGAGLCPAGAEPDREPRCAP